MHIVHLVPTLSTAGGGITEAALGLTKALSTLEDIRITVLATHASEDCGRWDPLEIATYSSSTLRDLHPDLLHLHGLWTPLSLASVRYAPRTIVSPHGMLDPWALKQSRFKKKIALALFERANLRRAGAIHSLNNAEAKAIAPFGSSEVIPNGVDLPELDPLQSPSKNLVFLGRIHPKKGIAELLEGWKMSKAIPQGWTLTIAGWDDGGHRENLEKNLPRNVRFVGPKFGKEKHTLLRDAGAFILPSFSEGLPVGILEAWSYALPVVMTEACNLPEGFLKNAALPCTPNPASISKALDELMEQTPENRNSMGQNGRNLVESQFTWISVATQFEALYRRLI